MGHLHRHRIRDDKKPDVCPADGAGRHLGETRPEWISSAGPDPQSGLGSRCGDFDPTSIPSGCPGRPKLQRRTLDAMSAESAQSYLTARARVAFDSPMTALMRKEMDFEVAFVKAGGLLLTGPDQPETAAYYLVSAISATSSFSSRRVSLRRRPSRSPPKTALYISDSRIESELSRRQTGGPGFDQRRSLKNDRRD